ncbi:MAG: hypothetical protein GY953_41310, partial [bacterium]|nr:hypothetical protein [bacterium]
MLRKLSLFVAACTSGLLLAQAPGSWPDPIGNQVIPYQTAGITVGPMIGRPSATAARIWLRTDEPAEFAVVYGTALPLDEESPSVAGRTDQAVDNTGYVDLTSLRPNTRYYYGIRIRGYIADTRVDFDEPWPSFRTLPDTRSYPDAHSNPDGLFNFSFSIGCGMRQRTPNKEDNFGVYSNPPSFRTLYKRHANDLAFHIVNGDYTYEETLDGTLAGYENNYRLYLTRGRNVSNFFRYVPVLFTYDDHEVNSNLDGSGEVGVSDGNYLRRDLGLKVWDYYAAWANYDARSRGVPAPPARARERAPARAHSQLGSPPRVRSPDRPRRAS